MKKMRSVLALAMILILCLQITPHAANVTQFSDVPVNHWAYEGIAYVVQNGYMGETQDGLFEPDSFANRGMIITVLYRLAGEPTVNATSRPFSDVPLGEWYSDPIVWAKQLGVIDGHDDGTFRPNDPMTREQISLIMCRYAETLNYDTDYAGSDFEKFPDFNDTPVGCQSAMKWAIKKDMLIGRADNKLYPNASATRAELATCIYRFVANNRHLTGISFSQSVRTVNIGWTGRVGIMYHPNVMTAHLANPKVTWASSDPSVASVDSQGNITAHTFGTTTLSVTTVMGGFTANMTLHVLPSLFATLINQSAMSIEDVVYTDDGMCALTKSVADILASKGISTLEFGDQTTYFGRMFDDWYIYSVYETYGLYKMREQEYDPDDDEDDTYDEDDPGVTVSFVEFETQALVDSLASQDVAAKYILHEDLTRATGPDVYEHSDHLVWYFSQTSSKGAYLIAENYVRFLADQSVNGRLPLSKCFSDRLLSTATSDEASETEVETSGYVNRSDPFARVINALLDMNVRAQQIIFDPGSRALWLTDSDNLSLHEKQAILAAFCGNVTFNSFAAEVEFHADAIYSWQSELGNGWYESALRADMAFGEEYESGYYDEYYDLTSDIVVAQRLAHGDY